MSTLTLLPVTKTDKPKATWLRFENVSTHLTGPDSFELESLQKTGPCSCLSVLYKIYNYVLEKGKLLDCLGLDEAKAMQAHLSVDEFSSLYGERAKLIFLRSGALTLPRNILYFPVMLLDENRTRIKIEWHWSSEDDDYIVLKYR